MSICTWYIWTILHSHFVYMSVFINSYIPIVMPVLCAIMYVQTRDLILIRSMATSIKIFFSFGLFLNWYSSLKKIKFVYIKTFEYVSKKMFYENHENNFSLMTKYHCPVPCDWQLDCFRSRGLWSPSEM